MQRSDKAMSPGVYVSFHRLSNPPIRELPQLAQKFQSEAETPKRTVLTTNTNILPVFIQLGTPFKQRN